ncbi:TauD/TfdA dioxygenase family protein [Methylobacterium brachythecii]|uniref:Taurine dioxygenase n=1 Tax=Methylobacterium brachythecii TaxID=1176177 RepID=A0A7W6AFI1_9HYPH|nr:TauD/TfdA family dioxygenase [Methylobacterium brachythecii]MBB3902337.1 taurine dioxygenase [Methylobacterium brachythecii]GLS42186.1 alpha-ketoglutarate-dependent taurine dioxygenase [Methylobacterium brachythecii]
MSRLQIVSPRTEPSSVAGRAGSSLSITRLGSFVGAEIGGIDLARPLDDATRDAIAEALAEHGVVFFRDQHLTPEEQIAFAERFGRIDVNRFFRPVEGHPQIAEVRKEAHQAANIGSNWHTDHSYDQHPAKGSILLAREVPSLGGDTLFASMYAAYDALSDGLKATLAPLKSLHSSRHVFGSESRSLASNDLKGRIINPEAATQDAVHPVVITHPDSGRKALYVNPNFTLRIEGWTEAESAALLGYLYEHARKPEFAFRFRWQPGSIAFWDNRATWHLALNDYHGERRLMHRITIAGSALH